VTCVTIDARVRDGRRLDLEGKPEKSGVRVRRHDTGDDRAIFGPRVHAPDESLW
jgi:hypothetical protein